MKKFNLPLLFVFLIKTITVFPQSITVGEVERSYLLHVPENLNTEEDVPLLIVLHSLGATAASFEITTKFSVKADAEGFIAVYPQGIDNSWNGGFCCDPAVSQGIDDIGFIDALIDTLIEELPVDANRIFLTGFSNGAILGYSLAARLSEKIAGFAAVGGLLADTVDMPTNPVAIMHIHALDDQAVNINGQWGFPSVYELLNAWRETDNITAEPDTFRNDSRIKGILHRSADDQSNIILYTSENGGHQWDINSRLGTTNRIWEFFETGHNAVFAADDTIQEGPRKRDFIIHIPDKYYNSPYDTIKYPLIIVSHGWNQTAPMIEDITGFSDLSNSRGFFVSYLHYVGPPPNNSWNYFMDPAKPDDMGYAKAVIDTMFARFPIDSSKVFAAGFSDGCGMSNRLALEMNGLIKATGTVGGMIQFDAGVETHPVKMIHIHAKSDPAVSYANTRNTTLNYWLNLNECDNLPDTLFNDRGYIVEEWTNPSEETEVLFFTIPWAQHAWPENNGTSMYVDATDVIWGFFNDEIILPELPPVENIEEFNKSSQKIKLFPNPSYDKVTMQIDLEHQEHLILKLFQTDGKQIFSADLGLGTPGTNRFAFDVTHLPENLYILRIVGDSFTGSESLIVQ